LDITHNYDSALDI